MVITSLRSLALSIAFGVVAVYVSGMRMHAQVDALKLMLKSTSSSGPNPQRRRRRRKEDTMSPEKAPEKAPEGGRRYQRHERLCPNIEDRSDSTHRVMERAHTYLEDYKETNKKTSTMVKVFTGDYERDGALVEVVLVHRMTGPLYDGTIILDEGINGINHVAISVNKCITFLERFEPLTKHEAGVVKHLFPEHDIGEDTVTVDEIKYEKVRRWMQNQERIEKINRDLMTGNLKVELTAHDHNHIDIKAALLTSVTKSATANDYPCDAEHLYEFGISKKREVVRDNDPNDNNVALPDAHADNEVESRSFLSRAL